MNRFRSRGSLSPLPNQLVEWKNYNCSSPSWANNSYTDMSKTLVGKREEMWDNVTPSWRRSKLLTPGGKPLPTFNNMIYSSRAHESGGGVGIEFEGNTPVSPCGWKPRWRNQGDTFPYYVQGNYTFSSAVSDTDISKRCSYLGTRVLSQRHRPDANLFESLAELDKSFAMFRKPLARLGNALSHAERSKRQGKFAGYAANGFSNLWLQYRYGIKPILNDIEAVRKGLKLPTESAKWQTTRASDALHGDYYVTLASSAGITTCQFAMHVDEAVKIRMMSLDEYDATLLHNIGFSAKGLLTLPWELVPYSFVVDWFVNVGDFIGAYAVVPGFSNLGSAQVIEKYRSCKYIPLNTTVSSGYTLVRPITGSFQVDLVDKSRVCTLPSPSLSIVPNFRFDEGVRVADTLSLLTQQFSRVFR